MKPPPIIVFVLALAAPASVADDAQVGREIRVPYRLTQTNLTTVRAKINGKGPFWFLVDSGAPALIVFGDYAKHIGLKKGDDGWAHVEQAEIEGGAIVEKTRARINDPAQLTSGMNRAELERLRLAGILGYEFLARFQIEFDYTRPHLVWTKLDYTPPPAMGRRVPPAAQPPAAPPRPLETDLPASALPPRSGFIGVEIDAGSDAVKIRAVYKGGPAESAGLKRGDRIIEIASRPIRGADDWAQRPPVSQGEEVAVIVERGGERISVSVKTGSGL